jgi:serine/threonine-protein phosphatase with EF-hand domain
MGCSSSAPASAPGPASPAKYSNSPNETVTSPPAVKRKKSLDPPPSGALDGPAFTDITKAASEPGPAAPAMERVVSHQNSGSEQTKVFPVTEELANSAVKIQKLVRRKSSRTQLRIAVEWKIFNDIDLQDEAQMLMLANFMQTLLDTKLTDPEYTTSTKSPLEESASLQKMAETHQADPTLCVADINLSFNEGSTKMSGKNTMNFTIKKGPITVETVKDVLELYKKGGKLSQLSLQNILRQAYKFLKLEANIKRLSVSSGEKLAVIGDLHGQVKDLFFILDENGLPSTTNKYIFNGDFVDRGTSGVEVLVLLMCLYCAYPGCVNLNRGNHEDYAVCCVYGFQAECTAKYDDIYFGMFCELFNYLPVCSIVNDDILIIHGGLFHDPEVLLADIEAIDRRDYKVATDAHDEDEEDPSVTRSEYLQRLLRDALWSDPHTENSVIPNTRGSGVLFGPDHCRRFLDNNNLSMIVRSHECVRGGVAFPFTGVDNSLLCTVFSASNYGGSGNQAAYMVFTTHALSTSKPVRNSKLCYSVQAFTTSLIKQVSLETKNRLSMKELLHRKRRALKLLFESKDIASSGLVGLVDWAAHMTDITGLKILWIPLMRTVVPPECIEGGFIRYEPFLESLEIIEGSDSFSSEADVSSLYGPVEQLELIFKFFDKNGDGQISRSEFKQGCDHLNSTLPEASQFKDVDNLLKLLDLDGDDNIDKNELFEVLSIIFCCTPDLYLLLRFIIYIFM